MIMIFDSENHSIHVRDEVCTLLISQNGMKCVFVTEVVHIELCWKLQGVVAVDPGIHVLTKNWDHVNRLADGGKGIDVTHACVICPEVSVYDEHVNVGGRGDDFDVSVECLVTRVEYEMFSVEVGGIPWLSRYGEHHADLNNSDLCYE